MHLHVNKQNVKINLLMSKHILRYKNISHLNLNLFFCIIKSLGLTKLKISILLKIFEYIDKLHNIKKNLTMSYF
jgi:hypothetical protein